MLYTLLLNLLVAGAPARAAGPGLAGPPASSLQQARRSEEDQAQIDEAAKEAERRRAERLARVVVLKWPETSTDYQDETLVRSVRSRIARPDAMFFPSVDLYQNGRKSPDRTLGPASQPAAVPDANLETVRREVERVSQIPWDAMTPAEWGVTAGKLLRMVDLVWFIEKAEQREPLFLLYAQIGRAAENQNNPAPPFYEAIGSQFVNYYHYLAARMALEDPSLMSKLTDQEQFGYVNSYLQQLKAGAYPTIALDFELENQFDLESFDKQYAVFLDGLPIELDEQARITVPLGRIDIYMQRKDAGHGLSERIQVTKLEEKAYFVRDVARKRMGIEFIDQLMLHPNECSPELQGDILNFLAIYARLHPKAEIYIAVPENGNPNRTRIWRFDRQTSMLQLVGGGPDSYPVHFAVVASAGLMYNGAAVQFSDQLTPDDLQSADPGTFASLDLATGYVPVGLELRAHFNRLMVAAGLEGGYDSGSDQQWAERYHTPIDQGDYGGLVVRPRNDDSTEALHYTSWNRYLYGSLGFLLGRDAGIGLGPRLAVRVGPTNLPYAVQATAHFGWNIQIPGLDLGGRVRPFADADLRAGGVFPLAESLMQDAGVTVAPVFGATVGAGTTF